MRYPLSILKSSFPSPTGLSAGSSQNGSPSKATDDYETSVGGPLLGRAHPLAPENIGNHGLEQTGLGNIKFIESQAQKAAQDFYNRYQASEVDTLGFGEFHGCWQTPFVILAFFKHLKELFDGKFPESFISNCRIEMDSALQKFLKSILHQLRNTGNVAEDNKNLQSVSKQLMGGSWIDLDKLDALEQERFKFNSMSGILFVPALIDVAEIENATVWIGDKNSAIREALFANIESTRMANLVAHLLNFWVDEGFDIQLVDYMDNIDGHTRDEHMSRGSAIYWAGNWHLTEEGAEPSPDAGLDTEAYVNISTLLKENNHRIYTVAIVPPTTAAQRLQGLIDYRDDMAATGIDCFDFWVECTPPEEIARLRKAKDNFNR